MTRSLARGLWLVTGAALILLPALPLPRWTEAPDIGPAWGLHLSLWAWGILLVVFGGAVAGRVGAQLGTRSIRWPPLSPVAATATLAVLLTGLSAFAMRDAFASNPHLIDEIAQLFQARIFAAGRLAAPPPQPPEFFLITQTLVTDAGWVSQYPPGQAILLAGGLLFGAEWLVNPLLGGLSVLLMYVMARGLYGPKTGMVAAFLWAASAWVLFMSATYMNHVAATTFALVAWGLVWAPKRPTRWHLLAAGFMLAATATARPLDAAAAALPIVVWAVVRRRWTAGGWMLLGALPLALVWGYLNWRLYGAPLTLGYTALYGGGHGLGFHVDPWGRPYTPLTGLSNLAVAIRRLHIYFYEWPIPALLPLALWAILGRQRSWRDLVVVVGVIAGPLLYFFYWHSGFYPGPRFYYIAAPWMVLGTARAWRWASRRARNRIKWAVRWDVVLVATAGIVLIWGWIGLLPSRWDVYRSQLISLKRHPEQELAEAGVHRALVIVPESWSSRIVTNLWGLGAPPGLVERVFNHVDSCDLHRFGSRARRAGLSGRQVADSLERLLAAGEAVSGPRPDGPDPLIRLRTGLIPADCQVEVQRDREGFTLYGHLAWRNKVGLADGIVFARDLYERNDALFAQYGDWPIWRYAPPAGDPKAPPVLTRLRVGDVSDSRSEERP